LLSLDEGDFNAAATTLKEVFSALCGLTRPGQVEAAEFKVSPTKSYNEEMPREPMGQRLTRENGQVLIDGDPLTQLSAGYKSVVALLCDVLSGMGRGLSDLRYAEGVVLTEEIGAHLHPRWRMTTCWAPSASLGRRRSFCASRTRSQSRIRFSDAPVTRSSRATSSMRYWPER
jgi:hypothetical protein